MNQPAANLNLDEQRWVIRDKLSNHSVIVSFNLALAETGQDVGPCRFRPALKKALNVRIFAVISLLSVMGTSWRKQWLRLSSQIGVAAFFGGFRVCMCTLDIAKLAIFVGLQPYQDCARAQTDVVGLRLYVETTMFPRKTSTGRWEWLVPPTT